MPTDWLSLTTHRLDIYNESQAKEITNDLILCEKLAKDNTNFFIGILKNNNYGYYEKIKQQTLA